MRGGTCKWKGCCGNPMQVHTGRTCDWTRALVGRGKDAASIDWWEKVQTDGQEHGQMDEVHTRGTRHGFLV